MEITVPLDYDSYDSDCDVEMTFALYSNHIRMKLSDSDREIAVKINDFIDILRLTEFRGKK